MVAITSLDIYLCNSTMNDSSYNPIHPFLIISGKI